MYIRIGFEITLQCDSATPLVLALSPRPEEENRLIGSSRIRTNPETPQEIFIDTFGNKLTRMVAGPGPLTLRSECIAEDSGLADDVNWEAHQHSIEELPLSTLDYLAPSRYCESDSLSDEAWRLFGKFDAGWPRVQAICDFVHNHITFGYPFASSTKTALDALREGRGVCRDFAHLSVAFCRAMNIPTRYVTGYLGDIGVPPGGPGDFCAWFEVYLGGRWYTFDARYNTPRIGRILMAHGRDAADVAMITSYGNCTISDFEVWTEEVKGETNSEDFNHKLWGHRPYTSGQREIDAVHP